MVRHEVYCVRMPDRTRARSIPRRTPDTTIESDVARRFGGARSPTRGSISCGVTVVTEVRRERRQKAGKELVRQRPILGCG